MPDMNVGQPVLSRENTISRVLHASELLYAHVRSISPHDQLPNSPLDYFMEATGEYLVSSGKIIGPTRQQQIQLAAARAVDRAEAILRLHQAELDRADEELVAQGIAPWAGI